jgi:hypothetical protein
VEACLQHLRPGGGRPAATAALRGGVALLARTDNNGRIAGVVEVDGAQAQLK